MLIIICILLVTYFGFLILGLVIRKIHPLEKIALSFLVGLGIFTLLMFILSVIGMKITLGNVALLMVAFISLFLLIVLKTKRELFPRFDTIFSGINSFSVSEKTILILIISVLLFSLAISIYWPIYMWDALALYDFRAKVIVETGFFVQIARNFEYFAHYPLLTSLSHALVYLSGGKNPRFIYSLMFASFVAIFYITTRRFVARKTSLFFSLLLTTTPILFHHSTFAYTNLPYSIYLVVGMIYLYIYLIEGKLGHLLLSALMIGLSTWVRAVEPFWTTAFVLLIPYLLWKKRYLHLIFYSLIFFIIQQPWRIYLANIFGEHRTTVGQITTAAASLSKGVNYNSLIEIVSFIYKYAILSWGPILFLGLIVFAYEARGLLKRKNSLMMLIIIANLVIFIVGSYVFSLNYPGWDQIPDSARRLSMFFIPLIIYYVAISDTANNLFKKLRI